MKAEAGKTTVRTRGMGKLTAWQCRLAAWVLVVLPIVQAWGTGNATEEAIPKLRPPKSEMAPTFWEDYGLAAVVGGFLSLMLLAVVVWLLTRPKPVAATPPETLARRSLESLRGQPEDGLLLSRVSRILRRYLSAAFGLPPEQMTTTEFCVVLSAHPRVGTAIAGTAADFFRRCDERKFAPLPPPGALGAVETALKLVETAEQQLAAQPERGREVMAGGENGPAGT